MKGVFGMGWFTRDSDDDIDDIYNRLDDIYNKLEALDVVNAFASRLSRLEKTSAYLEDVLMETVKELEKRVETIEGGEVSHKVQATTTDDTQQQLNALRSDINLLKGSINGLHSSQSNEATTQRMNTIDEAIKALDVKVSYLELSKDSNPTSEIQSLKTELSQRDEQIRQLNKKIESLTYIIEEDSRNIKMVAKHIIDQANSMKVLKEELYRLTNGEQTLDATIQ